MADDDVWRRDWMFKFFKIVTAPGLENRILGEEQTLWLMGTGGLEPMVAVALLSCVVCRSLFCSLSCFSRFFCFLFGRCLSVTWRGFK